VVELFVPSYEITIRNCYSI